MAPKNRYKWPPKNRYNVNQVPLPVVCGQDSTYETNGTDQVWISQPASGLKVTSNPAAMHSC